MPDQEADGSMQYFDRAYRYRVFQEAGTTLKVGFPIMLAQLLLMSMNFVDTVMAGRLSAVDLAAVAIGSSLLLPFLVFGLGTLMAVNPIAAQNLGKRKFDQIGSNARQTLWISQLIALPFFFIIRNLEFMMVWIGIATEVIPVSDGYLNAISWGIFPIMAYGALRYFNEGMSVTRPSMYIALIATILNVPFNYILMYGKLGIPPLGAVGTGYASAIVYTIMFILMITFTYTFNPYQRFDIFGKFRRPDMAHVREVLSLGLPIGVSTTMEVSLFAIVSLMMGTLGTIAVAGHQIAINFAALTFMIPFGLSMAITARVGLSAGRGRIEEARFKGFVGTGLAVLFMSLTALFIILFPELIVSIYTSDQDVAAMAVQLLFMAAIFQVSDGLQVGAFGALRGLKDTKTPMFVNIFAYLCVGLSLAWYLGIYLEIGPMGLWTGLIAGLSVAGVMHTARFYYKTR